MTRPCTLITDQLFNLEVQFESGFNLEFQPKFGIQLGIPIPMGINLGECVSCIFIPIFYGRQSHKYHISGYQNTVATDKNTLRYNLFFRTFQTWDYIVPQVRTC